MQVIKQFEAEICTGKHKVHYEARPGQNFKDTAFVARIHS